MVTKRIIDAIVNAADAKVVKSLIKRIITDKLKSRPWEENSINIILTILTGSSTALDIVDSIMSKDREEFKALVMPQIYTDNKEIVSIEPTSVSILEGNIAVKVTVKDDNGSEDTIDRTIDIPEDFFG